ncbi:polycomb protein eed-like protein, partial [Euroglyphus maynei]
IDSVLCAQQILLDRLRSLNFQSKNVNDNHQHIDSWTDHQLPELARKILQLLSQTVSNWHLFEDDSNDAAEDDSEALTNDKLETLNQFVRSFLDFNKDYFSVNHNHWTSEDSHSDMALSDEDENDESIERINTRSTRRRQQQQQQQVTSPKSSVKQRAKNKNAKQSSPNQTNTNEKAMTTKLSTDKFLIDCSSSLMLKLNSSLYDPTFPVMYGIAFNSFSYPDNVFAVCGQSTIIAYRCVSMVEQQQTANCDGLQPLFAHTDRNDSYYCCCWSHDYKRPDRPYLCVAGERGVIRIIDVKRQCETKTLYGHGAAINDLKICSHDPSLMLSASKDSGIRLWNITTNVLIAIFGGVQGHRDEVLAIDFHRSRSLFVSVSIDHSIKIWSFRHHEVAKAIEKSRHFISDQNAQQFPTVSQHFPNYSTRDVHHNYIDSIQWFGDLLVTKSCDEKLIIWKPGAGENDTLDEIERRTYYSDSAIHGTLDSCSDSTASNVVIIRQFDLDHNNIWFVRFSLDLNEFILAVGNLQGHLFIYDLKHFDPKDYRLAFEVPVPIPSNICPQKKNNQLPQRAYSRVIRQTAFNSDGTILIVLGENSSVTRYDLLRVTKPMVRAYLARSLLNQ